MPKFTSAERILVKSIIAALSIKRIPEQDIPGQYRDWTEATRYFPGRSGRKYL